MSARYYILERYFYLDGTLNARKDGPLQGAGGTASFAGKAEALEYLADYLGDGAGGYPAPLRRLPGGAYTVNAPYVLRYGEYEAPEYFVRKVRGSDVK